MCARTAGRPAARFKGVKCINMNCGKSFSFISSLESAKYSWPNLRTYWYKCIDCNSGNHIKVSDGRYQQIEIIGAPGPEWEVINTFQEKSLIYRQDPSWLHIWVNEIHYEIKAKK